MRTLQELEGRDSQQDNRFKFFLLSFLDSDALARAHKEWMHSESQRSVLSPQLPCRTSCCARHTWLTNSTQEYGV